MDYLRSAFNSEWVVRIVGSVIALISSIFVYFLIAHVFEKRLFKGKTNIINNKKYNTIAKLIKSLLKYIFFIITVLVILKINGVNVTSMIAGVGIIGIILGFAIQDVLKDIVKGIDIVTEGYYQVGDVIKFENYTGKVLSIGIKTTKIQELYSLNIVSISNRNIEKVEIVSNLINIDIPLPYELTVKEAEKAIDYVVKNIKEIDGVDDVQYRGINALDSSSINYQVKVYCAPIKKIQIRRDALTSIVKSLEDKNISIPYTQIDIHQK